MVYYYARVQRFEKYLKYIPGPKRVPLLGNALEFPSSTVFLPKLMEYYNKYETNFKVYVGSQAYLFVVDPKDMELVMNHQSTQRKSDFYSFFRSWLGQGLITSFGDRWRTHRKIITPAFHFQILEEFIDVFNSQSEILVSMLKKECKKGNIDVYPFIGRCTLDIICETAFGTPLNAQERMDSEYVRCLHVVQEIFGQRLFQPILANKLLYLFTDTYWKERHAVKFVYDYTRSIISRRRQEFINNVEQNKNTIDSLGQKKKRAFLDLLLEYSGRDSSFTEQDILEEVVTFGFAGHDTIAATLAFTLDSLARHPDIQEVKWLGGQAFKSTETLQKNVPDNLNSLAASIFMVVM
ncbi:hypothetical protein Trydic_g10321 [Trypoxylus dichotomus]